jgi:hypothetical protein
VPSIASVRRFRRWLLLAVLLLAPAPARAQPEDGLFGEMALGVLGLACLRLPADAMDGAVRLFGMTPIADLRRAASWLGDRPARGWTLLHTARIATLVRLEENGACLLALQGVDASRLPDAVDRLARALRSPGHAVREEDVPRGFPRPELRARYILTPTDGHAASVLELRLPRDQPVGALVSLRPATP